MRILFASDLHGSTTLYEQLLELLRSQQFDLLILGGDLIPDGDHDEPYPSVSRYIQGPFRQFLQTVRQNEGPIVAMVLGNHDWAFALQQYKQLQQQELLVVLEHIQPWRFGNVQFVGYSHSPPSGYPMLDFERRDRKNDPSPTHSGYVWNHALHRSEMINARRHFASLASIEEDLQQITPPDDGTWMLVCHCPPFDTELDILRTGQHVGSIALRQFLNTHPPTISLHGHIHESPRMSGHWYQQLGQTLAVNAGQGEKKLCAAMIELEQTKVTLKHSLYR